MLELPLWSPMVSLAPTQFTSSNSLSNHCFSLIWCTLQCSQKSSLKTPIFSHNLSFNGVLISNDEGKTKMTLRLKLIVIQSHLWTVFQPLLATPWLARVSMPFHIHAKRNFGKKKVKFGSTKPTTMPMSNQYKTIQPINVS